MLDILDIKDMQQEMQKKENSFTENVKIDFKITTEVHEAAEEFRLFKNRCIEVLAKNDDYYCQFSEQDNMQYYTSYVCEQAAISYFKEKGFEVMTYMQGAREKVEKIVTIFEEKGEISEDGIKFLKKWFYDEYDLKLISKKSKIVLEIDVKGHNSKLNESIEKEDMHMLVGENQFHKHKKNISYLFLSIIKKEIKATKENEYKKGHSFYLGGACTPKTLLEKGTKVKKGDVYKDKGKKMKYDNIAVDYLDLQDINKVVHFKSKSKTDMIYRNRQLKQLNSVSGLFINNNNAGENKKGYMN